MNSGDFEEQLRRQPMRRVPGEWRGEILGAARAEVGGARLQSETGDRGPAVVPQTGLWRGKPAFAWLRRDRQKKATLTPALSHPMGEGETYAHLGWFGAINARLAKIFWPHPAAWAGLATVWLVISILNRSSTDSTEMAARKAAPPPPDLIMAMQEQRRTLARLIETPEPPPVEPPKPTEPRPRGELRTTVVVV